MATHALLLVPHTLMDDLIGQRLDVDRTSTFQMDLVLEQAEGYVKALEKSTLQAQGLGEGFEHFTEGYSANGESPKVII